MSPRPWSTTEVAEQTTDGREDDEMPETEGGQGTRKGGISSAGSQKRGGSKMRPLGKRGLGGASAGAPVASVADRVKSNARTSKQARKSMNGGCHPDSWGFSTPFLSGLGEAPFVGGGKKGKAAVGDRSEISQSAPRFVGGTFLRVEDYHKYSPE